MQTSKQRKRETARPSCGTSQSAKSSTVAKTKELVQIGIESMHRKFWQQATVAFERALAHIPNFLGVKPWCQRYFLDDEKPPPYSPGDIADIYSKISECRYSTGRFDDSFQYADRALRLSPNCQNAQQIKERCLHELSKNHTEKTDISSGSGNSVAFDKSCADQLSIVMFTNFTDKLGHYKEIAPPAAGLVKATFGAAVQTFGSSLMNCKRWLSYDRPLKESTQSRQYEASLSKFADDYGFIIKVFDSKGLQSIVKKIIDHIDTPYLLYLEHDQFFKPMNINLSEIISLLNRHNAINTIRFNKRKNIIHNFDYLLSNDQRSKVIPLLQTSAYSNMPQVLRVSTFKTKWLPICIADPMINKMQLRGKAIGIEEPLFKHYMLDIRQTGFEQAHENWGTYLYGGYDHPASVVHLGEMIL